MVSRTHIIVKLDRGLQLLLLQLVVDQVIPRHDNLMVLTRRLRRQQRLLIFIPPQELLHKLSNLPRIVVVLELHAHSLFDLLPRRLLRHTIFDDIDLAWSKRLWRK